MNLLEDLMRLPLPQGARVILAVSGGGDSMALAEACLKLGRWSPVIATVDHGLHPRSFQHLQAVLSYSLKRGCPVEILSVDQQRMKQGQGLEEAARRERYRLLRACALRREASLILTAHTAEDQLETLLMRLNSVSGLSGMKGITARSPGLARPWLQRRREELRAFLRIEGISWSEDPSNNALCFQRNRLRHLGLPALGEVFGAGLAQRAARSAENLASAQAALGFLLEAWLKGRLRSDGEGVELEISALQEAPKALQRLLLLEALKRAGRLRAPAQHLQALLKIAQEGGGRDLSAHLRAERRGKLLSIAPPLQPRLWRARQPTGAGCFGLGWFELSIEALPELPSVEERSQGCIGVPPPWRLRRVQAGDRYQPLGASGQKRLNRRWRDAGVSRVLRESLPILEARGLLLWAGGLRIAEAARVSPGAPCWRIGLKLKAEAPQKLQREFKEIKGA